MIVLEYKTPFDFCMSLKDRKERKLNIFAKYEEARSILKTLIKLDYEIDSLQIEYPYVGEYDKEYVISINEYGKIWCERAYSDFTEDYLTFYYYNNYVLGNCNSKILKHISANDKCTVYEVDIEE